MINTFSNHFFSVFKSITILFKPELRRYVVLPLLINVSLFSFTLYYIFSGFSNWMDSLLPAWLDWLNWIILPLFSLTILISVFYSFTIIGNIIAAPFNSLLSEKYQQLLTGHIETDDDESIIQLLSRTLSAELKKLSYIILWLIPLLIITVIPFINLISPFLWIVFAIWMLSLEYLDYPMANHNLRFPQVRQTAHQQKSMTLGLGSGLFILTSIPLLNFIAIPAGVIAATKAYSDITGKKD
ncbi:MAG: sulfate transporter CysZ [Gammaproteobacteria bacterium]|nr:sulfate transporter CysZ [Gammaproteobacteria bacterium]